MFDGDAQVKEVEVLFDGFKVRLETGEKVWIPRARIEDYLPNALVPVWYEKQLLEKLREREGRQMNDRNGPVIQWILMEAIPREYERIGRAQAEIQKLREELVDLGYEEPPLEVSRNAD